MKLQNWLPTRSTIAHMRFVFSFFLLPVFLFALSQTTGYHVSYVLLVFFIWHFLAFPASNGYNSYFDKDEESIALLEKPPGVDISLYYSSIFLEVLAFLLAFIVSWEFAIAVLIYGIMSKLYSHPLTRLKKYPVLSFLVVFFFQGAFIYWTTYAAMAGSNIFNVWNMHYILAGVICSCLIGASYPLTQIYQHVEDGRRGDKTLSMILGYKGSFIFSGCLFAIAILASFYYWHDAVKIHTFYMFLACAAPIFLFFNYWFYEVGKSTANANFKNAMTMNFLSATCMVVFFTIVLVKTMFVGR